MDNKFQKTFTVRSLEMDSNYCLKKIEISRYFQETFALCCKQHGFAAFDIIKDDLIWVISELHIEFSQQMPKWSEDVTVSIWFSEITKLRVYVDFEITSNGKSVAKGDSLWFILNSKTKRPTNPNNVLNNIKPYGELVFGEHSKFELVEDGNLICEKTYKVGIFDIDFNQHMNNICYASFALHCAPVEILTTAKVKSYKIKFLKECFLDDVVNCKMFKNTQNFYFIQEKTSDFAQVCKIEIEIEK